MDTMHDITDALLSELRQIDSDLERKIEQTFPLYRDSEITAMRRRLRQAINQATTRIIDLNEADLKAGKSGSVRVELHYRRV